MILENISLFQIGIPIALFILCILFYKSAQYNWLPEGIKRSKTMPLISLLLLVPRGFRLMIGLFFSETKMTFYANQEGILKSMQGDMIKKWYNFYRNSIQGEKSLLKFQMKNLRYFSIQYDQEYFHEYKKEIISFLDSKLTRI